MVYFEIVFTGWLTADGTRTVLCEIHRVVVVQRDAVLTLETGVPLACFVLTSVLRFEFVGVLLTPLSLTQEQTALAGATDTPRAAAVFVEV